MNLNFDTLEHILNFCDIQSIYNFLISSKKIYQIYLSNKNYIDRIISKKILEHFNLNFTGNNVYKHILYNKNSFIVHKQLCFLYKKNGNFDDHRIADYLKTLINIINEPTLFNESNDSNHNYNLQNDTQLFNFLLDKCNFKFWIKEKDSTNRNILSSNDIEYILIHGSIYIVNNILSKFYISSGIITQCISTLITQHNISDEIHVITKIHKYIKYLVVKNFQKLSLKTQLVNPYYIFDTETDMYFHEIIMILIKHNKIKIIEGILLLKRKYKLQINYDKLINYTVELDNIKILKMLYKENRLDYFNSRESEHEIIYSSNFNVKVSNYTITTFFELGTLKSLPFIINNNLFGNINNKITFICNGLTRYFNHINNTYIFENKNSSILKKTAIIKMMQKLDYITSRLTPNSRLFINKHINLLQIRAGMYNPFLLQLDQQQL